MSRLTRITMIHWNANPELLDLGWLSIRWYGLLFAAGFFCGFLYMKQVYLREQKPVNDLDTLLLYMMISAVVGARLGHCFFYEPAYYLTHPLEILMVWQGGLASHGGAIGICLGLWLYSSKRPDQPYLWLLDRIAIPTALAGSFIRLGNLFNSEILGTPSNLPWAFVFERFDMIPRHPVQLYESIAYLVIFGVLATLYRRWGENSPKGMLLGLFLVLVFTARFFLEFMKLRQADYGQDLPLSVGQLLSIPAVLLGVYLIVRRKA